MRLISTMPSPARPDFVVDEQGRARALKGRPFKRAALGLAAATMVAGSASAPGVSEAVVAATQAVAKSAADLIRARSPGLRTRAHLIKTKPERAAPRQARAKPRVRQPVAAPATALLAPLPPAVPLVFDSPAPAIAFAAPQAGPIAFIPPAGAPCCLATINPPMTTVGGYVFGPGGGGTIPPPGGGGETPPPAVPEPSTWAAMILGFVLIGSAWRRRRVLIARLRQIPLLFYRPVLLLARAATT